MENPSAAVSMSKNRLQSLDVLRGIAVLMVVAAHFLSRYMPGEDLGTAMHSLGVGGVVLFFNLSGFLVYRSITSLPVSAFILRRSAKIFPAYWVTIALYFLLSLTGAYDPMPGSVYFSNLVLLQDFLGGVLLFGHFWTLVVEAKFYALVALAAPLYKKHFSVVVPAIFLALNMAFYLKTGRGSTLLTNMPIFFSGVLACCAIQNGWTRSDRLKLLVYLLTVAPSMLFFQQYSRIEYAVYVVASAAALVVALLHPFANGWLSYFGRISYSLYLLHPVLGFRIETYLVGHGVPDPIATLLAVLASIGLADLCYRLIEVRGVQLGRWLEARIIGWRSRKSA